MFIIAGIIGGLLFGIFRGRALSDNRSDRIMYAVSYTLAGLTLGAIATILIQFLL